MNKKRIIKIVLFVIGVLLAIASIGTSTQISLAVVLALAIIISSVGHLITDTTKTTPNLVRQPPYIPPVPIPPQERYTTTLEVRDVLPEEPYQVPKNEPEATPEEKRILEYEERLKEAEKKLKEYKKKINKPKPIIPKETILPDPIQRESFDDFAKKLKNMRSSR